MFKLMLGHIKILPNLEKRDPKIEKDRDSESDIERSDVGYGTSLYTITLWLL